MEAEPDRQSFMDPSMKALGRRMTPLPGDLRLYGGTALALYLGHRFSCRSRGADRDYVDVAAALAA